jgi:hypothetical protein
MNPDSNHPGEQQDPQDPRSWPWHRPWPIPYTSELRLMPNVDPTGPPIAYNTAFSGNLWPSGSGFPNAPPYPYAETGVPPPQAHCGANHRSMSLSALPTTTTPPETFRSDTSQPPATPEIRFVAFDAQPQPHTKMKRTKVA